jgi:RNA polymerase sigma-70 factor, ECF subfamily
VRHPRDVVEPEQGTLPRLQLDQGGRPREVPLEEARSSLDALLDSNPEVRLLRSEARALLRSALAESFRQLEPRERSLLRLHHVSGVPHAKLGEMMGAPRSTVAHWLAQARSSLMERTRAWLQRERALQTGEVDSLLEAAGSRLDITLSDVLVSRP